MNQLIEFLNENKIEYSIGIMKDNDFCCISKVIKNNQVGFCPKGVGNKLSL